MLLIPFAPAEPAEAPAKKSFVAYAWSGTPGAYEHIIRMHWLVGSQADPVVAKQATDAMPEGHRVLFSRDAHRWYHYDYVLTGMRAGGSSVWRFTPRLETGEAREAVLLSSEPPVFRTRQSEIRFDQGSVYVPNPELSNQGFWILAPPDAVAQIQTP